MFSKLKKLSDTVYLKLDIVLKDLKKRILSILGISSENNSISAEKIQFKLKKKGKSLHYILTPLTPLLCEAEYSYHIKELEKVLCLSENIARIRVELVCKIKNVEKAVQISLPKNYTFYEDSISEDSALLYADLVLSTSSYKLEKLLDVVLDISLYSKTYRIKKHTE